MLHTVWMQELSVSPVPAGSSTLFSPLQAPGTHRVNIHTLCMQKKPNHRHTNKAKLLNNCLLKALFDLFHPKEKG